MALLARTATAGQQSQRVVWTSHAVQKAGNGYPLKRCTFNRTGVCYKAMYEAVSRAEPGTDGPKMLFLAVKVVHPQAAASSSLKEPLISALRPFSVIAGTRS